MRRRCTVRLCFLDSRKGFARNIQVNTKLNEHRPLLISLIVAVAENGIIGRDGDLPWRMSSDLKTFRRLTMGKPVIMGRKTFETLKKPLDGRTNIVVTRGADFKADGVVVTGSVDEALEAARQALATDNQDGEVMVMGGAEIYAQTVAKADRIYFTEIHATPDGDTTFPPLGDGRWKEVSSKPITQGPGDDHGATLRVLERIQQDE